MAINVFFNPINHGQWTNFNGNRYQASTAISGMAGNFVLDASTNDPGIESILGPGNNKDFVFVEIGGQFPGQIVLAVSTLICEVHYGSGSTCQQIVDGFNAQLGQPSPGFMSLSAPADATFVPVGSSPTVQIALSAAVNFGLIRPGIFNQNTSIYLVNPERIFALGGTKTSQLSVPNLNSLILPTAADISLISSDWANTKWTARGWTVGDLPTLKSEIKTWVITNFDSRPVVNTDNDGLDLIMMRGNVGGTDCTVAFTIFGNQGADIPIVLQRLVSAITNTNTTLFLDINGRAWSVGNNVSGVLGINAAGDVTSPVSVVGGRSYNQIAMSQTSAAAIESGTGNIYSWGQNDVGQLGLNTLGSVSSPTSVVGGASYIRVALAFNSMHALDSSGRAWSTGDNSHGQLGTGDMISHSSPVSVIGGRTYTEISGGQFFSCAIEKTTGSAYCWGFNGSGELGNNDNTVQPQSSPVLVVGGRSYTKIATDPNNESVLAIEGSTGNLYAWGNNNFGQLGIATAGNQASPNSVQGGRSYIAVATGGITTAAIDSNNDLWVWGQNSLGQFGIGLSGLPVSSPVRGALTKKFASVSTENGAVVAVELGTGAVYSWGKNQNGYLGIGPVTQNYSTPISVSSISYTRIYSGASYSLAQLPDGTARAWGSDQNAAGLMGDGTGSSALAPVSVSGGISFSKLSTNSGTVLGLTGGVIYGWGNNTVGQLGLGNILSKSTPTLLVSALTFANIGSGPSHNLAVDTNGFAWTWGRGINGQLGRNSTADASTPVSVVGGHSFSAVYGGNASSYALEVSTNRAWAWGSNAQGVLGTGGPINTSSPVLVTGGRSYSKLSVLSTHVQAIEFSTGLAFGWGQNLNGQLGTGGPNVSRSAPIGVAGGKSYSSISAGNAFTVAIEGSTGLAWSWGNNPNGQLGNGTSISASTPVSVLGGRSYSAIAAGSAHCLALEASTGIIWGWGQAVNGELGNSQSGFAFSPVSVTHVFNV